MKGGAALHEEIKECLTWKTSEQRPQEVWGKNKPCEYSVRVFQVETTVKCKGSEVEICLACSANR